jgi:cytochrome c peroxidase
MAGNKNGTIQWFEFAQVILPAIVGGIVLVPLADRAPVVSGPPHAEGRQVSSATADVPFPKDNPPTREKIDLGRQLFFDRRLSGDESISCASCHKPEHAFGDNVAISRGIGGQRGTRSTPTLINAAFQPYQFWDGRASSLEDQALLPMENPVEMGSSIPIIVDRLNQLPQYRDAFRQVFDAPVTRANLAQALASFERTILAGDSAYDRYAAGNPAAMSPKATEGMKLFEGKAHCRLCHQGSNFSDGLFHNLGVGWNGNSFADEGRRAVTGIVKDRGAFKTPTLRQIDQTAPYMHDGSLASLEAVVDFYDRGGKPNPHLDPLIQPVRLTLQEKKALIEFLRSLSGTVSFHR